MSANREKIARITFAKGVEDALEFFLGSGKVAQQPMPPQGAPMQPGMPPQGQPMPQPSPEEMEMQAKQMKLDAENAMMQARQMKSQQQEAQQQAQLMQQGVPPMEAQQVAAAQPNLADMQAQQEQLEQLRAQQGQQAPAPQMQAPPPSQMMQDPAMMQGAQPMSGSMPAPEPIPGPQEGLDINDPVVVERLQAAYQYLLDQGVPEPRAIQYIRSMLGEGE